MPFYNFWALSDNNITVSADILAKSKADAITRLESYGYRPFTVSRVWQLFLSKFSDRDRFEICASLTELLKAGVPLQEALASLAKDQSTKKLKIACLTFADGIHFGMGMNGFDSGDFFDEIALQSLYRAQHTGNLTAVLETLTQYYENRIEMGKERQNIFRYPIFVVIMLFVLVGILGTFLLPNLERFLPKSSQGFAYTSFKYFFKNIHFFISGFCAFIMAALFFKNSLYVIPALARYKLCSFWTNFSFCLKHDLPLLDALEISKKGLPEQVQKPIDSVIERIHQGRSLHDAFLTIPSLSASLRSLIQLTEKTGNLEATISQIANLEKKFNKNLINFFIFWTQPFLLLMMGGIVLWILHATLLPLYDSMADLQQ
jgi:general secretion pathway protein F